MCRYDANVGRHHHFRCRECGKIEDIAWEQFQGMNVDTLKSGAKVDDYEVIVHGLCSDCVD